MKALRFLLILLALQGCSTSSTRQAPAPVSEPGETVPVTAAPPARPRAAPVQEAGAQLSTYPASAPGGSTAPTRLAYRTPPPVHQPAPAIQALLERAEVQREAGDLPGAAATLERALRIAPRNPHLWNRLARIRLEQGRSGQAGSLAAKSSTLAGDDPQLKEDNRRIQAIAGWEPGG